MWIWLLSVVVSYAAPAPIQRWSWSIDGANSVLTFTNNAVIFESPLFTKVVKPRACSKAVTENFKSSFEKRFEKTRAPAFLPKDYKPIYLVAAGGKEVPILRGHADGLYLLNFESAFADYLRLEAFACKK